MKVGIMQISSKGRYALRFLLDLCQHQGDGCAPLKAIAERQDISKKYLEHVIALLTPTGMLKVTRGYQGGYRLNKKPADITVADVLRITEGTLAPVPCLDDSTTPCARQEDCMTRGVWEGLEHVITDYLEGITLQDILDTYGPGIEYFI
jgi:Rrf2 family protein